MTAEQGARQQAWLDNLHREEYAVAERVIEMPGGSMAVAYVMVELHRFKREVLAEIRKGNGKEKRRWPGWSAVGGAFGGALAVGALTVLRALGIG